MMLTLDESQWQALQRHDEQSFVATVCDRFLSKRPDRASRPGHTAVLSSMQEAYDYAVRTGFTSTPHIVHLLYLAGDAPRFYEQPQIALTLRKPGATPEQRFDDLWAVLRYLHRGGE